MKLPHLWTRPLWILGVVFVQFCSGLVPTSLAAPAKSDELLQAVPVLPGMKPPKESGNNGFQRVVISPQVLRKSSFLITLPSGSKVSALRDEYFDYGWGDGVWTGHLDGEPLSRVTVANRRGVLSAVVDRPLDRGNEVYELNPNSRAEYQWYRRDDANLPPCLRPLRAPRAAGDTTGATTTTTSAPRTAADPIVVDIMVVYSPASRTRYGQSGIESKILQAVTDANTAFANSLVNIRYNLAYLGELAYTEQGAIATTLAALQAPADGKLDEVHAIRDQVGADLVCMVTEDSDACGLSYVMSTVSTSFSSAAFSVVYSGCLASLSLSHELGHNHGCQHDRANAAFAGAFPYSYGWRNCATDGTGYRTIMSYSCGGVSRVNYFSNPDLLYMGSPMGVDYTLDPANSADNARGLGETASVVASFRTSSNLSVALTPTAPTSLTAAAPQHNLVNLGWTDAANNEQAYSVERTLDGVTWAVLANLPAGSVSYADGSVVQSTAYTYRVRASNSAGSSAYSNTATVTTSPAPPGALAASALSSSQIKLTWADNASAETAFYVESSKDNVTFTALATLAANSTTYTASALAASTTCYFRVRNAAGTLFSSYSGVASATTFAAAPAAPTGLGLTVNSSTQITLKWTDKATTETAYYVERSLDGVTFGVIATLAANSTSFANSGLAPSTKYYYRVRAGNAGGYSSYTTAVSATTFPPPPSAPSGLTAVAVSSSQINLAWTDNSSAETSMYVERSTDGVTFTALATLAANSVSYSSTGLTASKTYYYRVRAGNSGGYSAYTLVASATTQAAPLPPAAPSALVLTPVSKSQINLVWTDNSTDETGFKIERSKNGSSWSQIGTVGANVTTYSSTGLTANTLYYYRVRANNGAVNSAYSNTASAKTLAQ